MRSCLSTQSHSGVVCTQSTTRRLTTRWLAAQHVRNNSGVQYDNWIYIEPWLDAQWWLKSQIFWPVRPKWCQTLILVINEAKPWFGSACCSTAGRWKRRKLKRVGLNNNSASHVQNIKARRQYSAKPFVISQVASVSHFFSVKPSIMLHQTSACIHAWNWLLYWLIADFRTLLKPRGCNYTNQVVNLFNFRA